MAATAALIASYAGTAASAVGTAASTVGGYALAGAKAVGGLALSAGKAVYSGLQTAAQWAGPQLSNAGQGLIHGVTGGAAGNVTGLAGNLANATGRSLLGKALGGSGGGGGGGGGASFMNLASASGGPSGATQLQTPGGGTQLTQNMSNYWDTANMALSPGEVRTKADSAMAADVAEPAPPPESPPAKEEPPPTKKAASGDHGDEFWDDFRNFMLGAGKFAGKYALAKARGGIDSSANFGPAAPGPRGPVPMDYYGQANQGLFNLNQVAAMPSRRGLAPR